MHTDTLSFELFYIYILELNSNIYLYFIQKLLPASKADLYFMSWQIRQQIAQEGPVYDIFILCLIQEEGAVCLRTATGLHIGLHTKESVVQSGNGLGWDSYKMAL